MPSSFSPEPKKAPSVLGGSLGVVRGNSSIRESAVYLEAMLALHDIVQARSADKAMHGAPAPGMAGPRAVLPVGNTGITSNGATPHA